MSVEIQNLTKIYGTQKAVNDLSFSAKKGEIVGFLGPNGAGKSTTMKMLTCYAEPTSGTAQVCGFDILKNPKDVRNSIGYLPEHNPLYKDMYVKEFLSFIAGIHKVSKPQKRIADLIEMTGLGLEQRKLIGALSKGYRQRVGLAQAMMHDPEVLILDEPTSGLDPNQLRDIRGLIERLGQEKTVIFSTHIMQEVTALCSRVLIINRGNLVADDPIESLQDRVRSEHEIVVSFENEINQEKILSIEGLNKLVHLHSDNPASYKILASKDIRKEIFQWAVANNQIILELNKTKVSVENVFRQLTKEQADV